MQKIFCKHSETFSVSQVYRKFLKNQGVCSQNRSTTLQIILLQINQRRNTIKDEGAKFYLAHKYVNNNIKAKFKLLE